MTDAEFDAMCAELDIPLPRGPVKSPILRCRRWAGWTCSISAGRPRPGPFPAPRMNRTQRTNDPAKVGREGVLVHALVELQLDPGPGASGEVGVLPGEGDVAGVLAGPAEADIGLILVPGRGGELAEPEEAVGRAGRHHDRAPEPGGVLEGDLEAHLGPLREAECDDVALLDRQAVGQLVEGPSDLAGVGRRVFRPDEGAAAGGDRPADADDRHVQLVGDGLEGLLVATNSGGMVAEPVHPHQDADRGATSGSPGAGTRTVWRCPLAAQ